MSDNLSEKTIHIGYLLHKRKTEKLNLLDIWATSKYRDSIEFHAIQPFCSLKEQNLTHLDCIIHRIHDAVIDHQNPNPSKEDAYIASFFDECRLLGIAVLEDLDIINRLSDRMYFQKQLEKMADSKICYAETVKIDKNTPKLDILKITQTMQFPVIVKTTDEICTDTRYSMSIFFNGNDRSVDVMHEIAQKSNLICQSYKNHSGILYKMFIVGKKWCYVERKSIKNFYADDSSEPIFFQSNTISKNNSVSPLHTTTDGIQKNKSSCCNLTGPTAVDPKVMKEIADRIDATFPCQLLGVDIIIEDSTQKYYVIDVNYFPGYDGFENSYHLGDALIELVKDRISYKNRSSRQ